MESALLYMIVALGISVIINLFMKKLGISQIIGYIITGIAISYIFELRHVADSHVLELIGEFGIVFLMFTIGLEISLERLGNMKIDVFFNGMLQVVLTSLIVYMLSHYMFDLSIKSSLIIAMALSLSSTAVVLSYLKSSKEIYTPFGQRSTGILIFQDLAVIPILLMIGFMSGSDQNLAQVLQDTVLSAAIVLFILFFLGKWFMSWMLHFSANSGVEELFMGSVLVIVVGASLFAHHLGFTYSLGAFIAGMIIAETKYLHKVEADIAPFKDLLLGAFFVVVGMKIDILYFVENIFTILLFLVLVLLIKALIIFLVIRIRSNARTAFKTALALSQVGEFSFAVFALADSSNLLKDEVINILGLVVVLSMIITPFLIQRLSYLTKKIFHKDVVDNDFSPMQTRKNHVIVCGYSTVGKLVSRELEGMGVSPVIVDNSLKHVKEGLAKKKEIYYGDFSKKQIMHAMHIEDAAAVILTLENPHKQRLICEAILKYQKNINLVVKINTLEEKKLLEDLPIAYIVDAKVEVSKMLVERTMRCTL